MKTLKKLQRAAIACGTLYALWLGGNQEATTKESVAAMIMLTLCALVAIGMMAPDARRDDDI